jgi:vacuolar-type H+-ATPase subunit H
MPQKPHSARGPGRLDALAAVLEAERQAAESVQAAYEMAARIRNEARSEARAVEARADRRVQTLHAAMQQRTAEDRAAREAAFAAEKSGHGPGDPHALSKAAAAALAARLVGIEPGS